MLEMGIERNWQAEEERRLEMDEEVVSQADCTDPGPIVGRQVVKSTRTNVGRSQQYKNMFNNNNANRYRWTTDKNSYC